MEYFTGKVLGNYLVQDLIAHGGMGVVYRGIDQRLKRPVAIKFLSIAGYHPANSEYLKRFEQEAVTLAQLTHPNIVRVLDFGRYQETPFIVMEYIGGGTLRRQMNGTMDYRHAARLLAPIARALECAHRSGIVHRDVKPANILITATGEAMLSDFGIVRLSDSAARGMTGTGLSMGTPEYMAPEQALGETVDGRADIYALGVVFYEMVTGRRPFVANTPVEVAVKHATETLPRPRKFVPNLPGGVEKVLLKALARKPQERFARMSDFAEALEQIGRGQNAGNERSFAEENTPTGAGRRRALHVNPMWLLSGALGLVFVALMAWGLWQLNAPAEAPGDAATASKTRQTAALVINTQVESQIITAAISHSTSVPTRGPALVRVDTAGTGGRWTVEGIVTTVQSSMELIGSGLLTTFNDGMQLQVQFKGSESSTLILYPNSTVRVDFTRRFSVELLEGSLYVSPARGERAEVRSGAQDGLLAWVQGSKMGVQAGSTEFTALCFEGECQIETGKMEVFGVPVGQKRSYRPTAGSADAPHAIEPAERQTWNKTCHECLGPSAGVTPTQTPWITSTRIGGVPQVATLTPSLPQNSNLPTAVPPTVVRTTVVTWPTTAPTTVAPTIGPWPTATAIVMPPTAAPTVIPATAAPTAAPTSLPPTVVPTGTRAPKP